ncbi:MAG: hypothetical protein LBB41_03630 [Prevotellaceae bacterium]|jgi:hypothetical protein|nr:hypothetical protein [Prevotellaceae bacterium]
MKQDIIKYIQQIVGNSLQNTEVCKVVSVTAETCAVEAVANGVKYENVRLKAHIEDDKGLTIKPAVGSYVIMTKIDEANYFISMFSEIDAVIFKDTQGFELVLKSGKLSVKNSNYALKQAFDELIDAIGRLTVTTGTGPSGIPINKAEFDLVKQKINSLFT